MSKETGKDGRWVIGHPKLQALLEDNLIDNITKQLVIEVDFLAQNEEGCYAKNSHFAKRIGVSEKTIKRRLSIAKKLGLVWQTKFDGKSRFLVSFYTDPELKPQKTKSRGGQIGPPLGGQIGPGSNYKGIKENNKRNTVRKLFSDGMTSGFLKSTEKTKLEIFCQNAVKLLSKHLRLNNLLIKSITPKWNKQFELLHTKDGVKLSLIKAVLKWYVKNLKLEFIPQAHSASAFRTKYDSIRNRMEKESKSTIDTENVEINESQVMPIFKRIQDLDWKISEKELKSIIQQSYNNLNDFNKRVYHFVSNLKKPKKIKTTDPYPMWNKLLKFMEESFRHPEFFISQFLINSYYQHVNISELILTESSTYFTKAGEQLCANHLWKSSNWHLFISELNEDC